MATDYRVVLAALLAVGPKAAGLAVLLRTLVVAFPGGLGGWPVMMAMLVAVTMTLGNVLALRQTNLKRLLAYLLAYLVMNLGAFLVVAGVGRHTGSDELAAAL